MNSLRSWNRREFNVAPNGFFTVLRATRWFPTWRPKGNLRYPFGKSQMPAQPQLMDYADGSSPEFAVLGTDGRLGKRLALITLGAAAFTSVLLWLLIVDP